MKLAINGGTPVRTTPFPNQANIGPEESAAAQRVIESQMLSGYRGTYDGKFGGVEVGNLENVWCKRFGSGNAIPTNSCTSSLHIACLAIGLKPGDEVIVSPYSMTCSATAPMIAGATPVFADIEPNYFCLDPDSVRSKITEKTKAIIVVDLFGQPFNWTEIMKIAGEHDLMVIEDAAQAPGAFYQETGPGKGIKSVYVKPDKDTKEGDEDWFEPYEYHRRYTGNLGHIGCFSFTQGKHMTSGEGGLITTDDPKLAEKCRLIMNHAESVVNDMWDRSDLAIEGLQPLWGLNMRMTEIQAAIVQEQLKKLDFSIGKRNENADYLAVELNKIPYITPTPIRINCTHTFYVQPFLWKRKGLDTYIHRDTFINAVKAELQPMAGRESEGVRIGCGYIKPIYRMPLFSLWQEYQDQDSMPSYFPNVERLWKDELFLHLYLAPPTNRADLDDIIEAFNKVWDNRGELG